MVRIWRSWEQALHSAPHWSVLNGSLSSSSWLCFVYSQLRPASGQLGFLHPVFIYNVWDQIDCIYPEMSLAGGDWSILRVCPREHQAIELYAISPNSMNFVSLKGLPKTKNDKPVSVWFFSEERETTPPPPFSWFSPRKSLQNK